LGIQSISFLLIALPFWLYFSYYFVGNQNAKRKVGRIYNLKEKLVGTYCAGYENITLFIRDGSGGDFNVLPDSKIRIGGDEEEWQRVVECVIHEIFELLLLRLNCRYNSSNLGRSNGAYLFVFNHVEFEDLCARASEFISACMFDTHKAWNSWRKLKKNG